VSAPAECSGSIHSCIVVNARCQDRHRATRLNGPNGQKGMLKQRVWPGGDHAVNVNDYKREVAIGSLLDEVVTALDQRGI
jgi:hypothetical protein